VRRRATWLLGLVVLPLLGLVPAAHATGAAVCSISGTIEFVPASGKPAQGVWSIDPAVIDCHGLFQGRERIIGPGGFSGSGSYTTLPSGSGACLHHVGSGTVDYTMQTTDAVVHLVEPHEFILAGAGAFTTPSLNGSLQITPPYDGDCVTTPVTKALFLAQGSLTRGGPSLVSDRH
jgi:hypothetical protein